MFFLPSDIDTLLEAAKPKPRTHQNQSFTSKTKIRQPGAAMEEARLKIKLEKERRGAANKKKFD